MSRSVATWAPAARSQGEHGGRAARVLLRILVVAMPVALAGYALGDKGFAYLAALPGTPIFAGELLLLLGGLYVAVATGRLRQALRNNLPLALLLMFAGWGLVRTIPLISTYGLDSIRDAALWYYALIAVLVAVLVMAVPELPHRWARWYLPLIAVLLLWAPLATALGNSTSPTVPGSAVGLFAHKAGNIAVAAATAVGFLWLVPTVSLHRAARAVLTALATVVILAVGTQNRGGLVAALAAIVLAGLLAGRRSRELGAVMVGTVVVGLVTAWGLNIHVTGTQGRDYSVAQLVENVVSTTGGDTSGNLGATVAFRDQLWSGVLTLAGDQGALTTGLGFGPNLAQQLNVTQGADPLRSPHNSHVDVLARMGLVGACLWLAFWLSWYAVMLRRSRERDTIVSVDDRGLIKVCLIGVTATLINAYFDPTLESPQVAIWIWSLVGLAVGITATGVLSRRNTTVAGSRH